MSFRPLTHANGVFAKHDMNNDGFLDLPLGGQLMSSTDGSTWIIMVGSASLPLR
ncbi:MAG: hypothetical protein IPH58_16665 [Sphingobacteriales bacterium]|nr:hypothetical protein [Sphingobacteriales bacterium]